MCSSSGRPFVHAVLYGMFFMNLYKQSSRWKFVLYLDIVLCCAEQDLLFTLIVWVYCIMTGIYFLVDKLLLIYFGILPLLEQNIFSL